MNTFNTKLWLKNTTIVSLLMVVLFTLSCNNESKKSSDPTVFYFIRHAEKDRSDTLNKNPNLTKKGLQRALGWSNYFDSIPLQKVYSTPYNRTQQTATPTATKKGLAVLEYRPDTIISETFINANKGNRILIVGHSNTNPYLVNALLKEDRFQDMLDTDNYSLYKVTRDEEYWEVEIIAVNK